MKSKGACEDCRGGKPVELQAVGETVVLERTVGRGYDSTTYSFSQCRACGSVWTKFEDSGAGGHGTFKRRLTETLF